MPGLLVEGAGAGRLQSQTGGSVGFRGLEWGTESPCCIPRVSGHSLAAGQEQGAVVSPTCPACRVEKGCHHSRRPARASGPPRPTSSVQSLLCTIGHFTQ